MLRPGDELVLQPIHPAAVFLLGVHVTARTGNEDVDLTFENVISSGTEFALAEDDLSLFEGALHHGSAIQFQECSGYSLEDRQRQKLLDFDRDSAIQVLSDDDVLVGQRSRGTRHHALSTGNA